MHGLDEIIAMNGNEDTTATPHAPSRDAVREYLSRDIRGFLNDPPSNSFQVGYLASLVAVAKEGFKEDMTAYPYADAEALLNTPVKVEGRRAPVALSIGPSSPWFPERPVGPASPWCPDTIGPSSEWPRKLGQERLEVVDDKLVFKPVEGAKCNNEYTDKSGHKHYNHAARVAEWNEREAA